jgi:hypothetical protein
MTLPLTLTVIVVGPSAADNNACTGTALADQSLPSGMPSIPPLEIHAIAAHRSRALAARANKSSSTRRRQPSPDPDRHEPRPLSP